MKWVHDRTPDGFSCWYSGKIGALYCFYIFHVDNRFYVAPGITFEDLEIAKLYHELSQITVDDHHE